jgi:U3 small nucleolar RNA-associated protein 21
MAMQESKKQLLDAYRTIGNFLSAPLSLSLSTPHALTAPTATSFKVYSPSLGIKVASPPFLHPVTAALSYNEYTYVRTRDVVVKMKYHHIVAQWTIAGGDAACSLLRFDGLVLLAEGRSVWLVDESSGEVVETQFGFDILRCVHPVTYVNKLLLVGREQVLLVNVVAGKQLYSYPQLAKFLKENQLSITQVEAAPLVDIVGLALSDGTLAFLNLKKDQIVFTLRQKQPATALAFSS